MFCQACYSKSLMERAGEAPSGYSLQFFCFCHAELVEADSKKIYAAIPHATAGLYITQYYVLLNAGNNLFFETVPVSKKLFKNEICVNHCSSSWRRHGCSNENSVCLYKINMLRPASATHAILMVADGELQSAMRPR